MKATVIESVQAAGKILMEHFGKISEVSRKQDQSNVVTEADLASEEGIVEIIQRKYPEHNILSEETGFIRTTSDLTWVIDPLDGTCNFAAGLPDFGVLIAILKGKTPILGAAYLPFFDLLYLSEREAGVVCNGKPVRVTTEADLSNVLCAYNVDFSPNPYKTKCEADLFGRLVNRVRNIRATNCLVDFCYTIDGRFGANVNQTTRIWDIAPIDLMLKEAGGILSDIEGNALEFDLGSEYDRPYSVIGASKALHAEILKIAKETLPPRSSL